MIVDWIKTTPGYFCRLARSAAYARRLTKQLDPIASSPPSVYIKKYIILSAHLIPKYQLTLHTHTHTHTYATSSSSACPSLFQSISPPASDLFFCVSLDLLLRFVFSISNFYLSLSVCISFGSARFVLRFV